jgi:ABC-2 type transport system permease protein
MTTPAEVAGADARPDALSSTEGDAGWLVVAEQECRDLWKGGRGPALLFCLSVLLSAITYLAATNRAMNFLEQREAVNLVLQFAVGVGVLVTLVVTADGISGERERETLESLLVTPVSRRAIVGGKLIAGLSLWGAAYVVTVPYIWLLARSVGILTQALALGLVVGTLVAAGLGAIGLLISALTNSNKASLAISVFLLVVLFAPTQLPSGLPSTWFFDVIERLNPVTSALAYITGQLVQGDSWSEDLSYLVSPIITVLLAGGVLFIASPRLVRLTAGVNGE